MLASWFERGLGQIVAPDEKHASQAGEEEQGETGFWSIVAPDPNFSGARSGKKTPVGPPPSAFPSPLPSNQVQCTHCHHWTPVAPSTPEPKTPSNETPPSALDGLVLSAAKETAISMTSPPAVAEARNKVFRLCASSKPLTDKLCQRLKRLLQKDPSLAFSRASGLGNMVPDGHTPLMAAAAANHVAAAQIILEEAPESALEVDLQGRTALHIAAEQGCMDMIDLLKSMHPEGPDAPVDLVGHTPLGRAVTSQHKGARQQRSQLKDKLFSPGDVSVCGRPTPAKERSTHLDLQIVYGYADMPGFRVMMEDAISCHVWHGHALLGVCDGHGDQGRVSEFVAEGVAGLLKEQLSANPNDVSAAWTTTCLDLDAQLKETGRKGGSTAVWALITETSITVANVGDSRCILIQKPSSPSLEQAMERLTLEGEEKGEDTAGEKGDNPDAAAVEGTEPEKGDSPDETTAPEKPAVEPQSSCVVIPMSEDHKPNLEQEQARIEKSGLSVFAETFMDNGIEQTIHKVQRSESDRLAVSRAFGDFEYKGNTQLGADEQAVVAAPEIRIHTRDAEKDMYLVLCCDGVWDVMSNQEVGEFVVKHAQEAIQAEEEDVLPLVGDLLLNECLQRGSTDNMTVVIAALSKAAEPIDGSSVMGGKTLNFPVD